MNISRLKAAGSILICSGSMRDSIPPGICTEDKPGKGTASRNGRPSTGIFAAVDEHDGNDHCGKVHSFLSMPSRLIFSGLATSPSIKTSTSPNEMVDGFTVPLFASFVLI